jgi:hypothetical protein
MNTSHTEEFTPNRLLVRLYEEDKQDKPETLPDALEIGRICTLTELFQPRTPAEKHIRDLVQGIRENKVLDPVDVIQIGPTPYLLDGHCRMTAYAIAKVS